MRRIPCRVPVAIAACLAVVAAAACGPSKRASDPSSSEPRVFRPGEKTEPRVSKTEPRVFRPGDLLRVRTGGTIKTVPLETYVAAAVLAEVSPLGETPAVVDRVFEVQAVIARTYAIAQLGRHRAEGFDVCDTTHCQLFDPARLTTSRFAAAAQSAVARTRGSVITYNGLVAEALFHSDCGGQTAAALEVWGGRGAPYLQIVDDHPVPAGTHRTWSLTAETNHLRDALNADPRTSVGARLDAIDVLARDDSGRASGLGVRGARSYTVRGDLLRAVLNRAFGERAIMSTRFTLTRSGARYTFEGTGFGHGVGLCQRGAIARARQGTSTTEILRTYYPGTKVSPR